MPKEGLVMLLAFSVVTDWRSMTRSRAGLICWFIPLV